MVIIGAGECGTRAALALRELGYRGAVALVGLEPHVPYERPPLSKHGMTSDAPELSVIAEAALLAERGIDYRSGLVATAIDRPCRRVSFSDGTGIVYDKLLLATGARPRPLPLPGADGPNTAMLRTALDADRIRAALGSGRRLAVIGGGFIGLELAASARSRGTEVTVIEARPRLLSRGVPSEIAATIQSRHMAEGVTFVLGAHVSCITPAGVALTGGEVVAADLVLIGIGAIPNTELAEAAGLAIEDGIAVDEHLRTSDAHIFAAGDCCSFPQAHHGRRRARLESWRSAQELGAVAARNMTGMLSPVAVVPWFWSDQYDLTLQIAGLAEGAAMQVRRDLREGAFILFHLDADGRLLAASGIGPGNAVARDIRLAEMMIARGLSPDPALLAAPGTNLKKLLVS